ncbi:K02A2.6-like [Cordylochernes scorpioides]|uniref:RNA-directed DNA polymerase n=1 Tax=Cordylochernes scorpioides TaxID=51811 RepID=A0ABY6K4P7_9ARAC|nr:K02A2.6-like [Cordylochernes scorpioides]
MASYQFKEYNEETETFETFYERLEQFLILDEKKKAYLLTLMGSKTYGVLKNLCSPILPKDKTFDNLIDILKRHFSPKRSIVVERILSEGDISLAKVIEIALSMEAAEKNTKLFHLEQGEDCVDKLRMERKVESNFQNGKCKHCGKQHKELCRFKEAICFKCNKKGHIASICWSSRRNLRQHQNQPGNIHQIGDQEEEEEYVQKIISVTIPEYKINFASSDPPYLMELKVEGNFIKFEMDTGSGLTLISEKDFKNSLQHLKLEKSEYYLECQDITYKLRALVVKGEKRALMGREWINRLKLGCFAVKHMPVEITIEEILKENQALFVETTEPIKGFTFSVNMCDVNPIFHKARPVPFAIRPAVTEALDKMVAKGYLCEVASSKWATPVVVVPKKNKEIRICCDFKVTLNKYLDTAAYPLSTQQDLFSTLAKGKYFSKLDLRNAYLQLEVDPGTRPLLTINTHKGLFRFKRMPFGLANAPSYFQSVMDRVLSGIGGVICYIDDVLIATASIKEHLALLKTIFARLAKYNIKLKKEKCLFLQKEIEYLGHLVTEEGIRPLDHKVQAIQKAKTPTNISELRSFLGLVNFYGKFIPNLPELLKPLHELLHKKRPWVWTKECGEAIDKCKNSITSERVLVPYDATLPLCLATDASQIGVGAVLSHIIEGQERPIMFASRTLSEAEQNYSQIEKEALAIIYGVTKFHQFIYGRKFILITDHKPLVTILGSRSGIPTLSTSRLQRWALILSAYTYDIKFRRTQDHGNADLLSRFPVGCEEIPRLNNVYALSYVEELPITAEEIATETEKDEVLSLAKFYTQQGWPEKVADHHLRPYFQRKLELTVDGECLVWGMRVVIPPSLRIKILNCLHETHSGMNKMKAVARSHFWWPNLDTQIEFLVNKCRSCQQSQDGPNKVKWQPWRWSTRPWQRIHIDFANKENINLLIVVDSHSKWIEAIPMRETTTRKTIEQLRRLFSSYGLPEELVSDNGPQFTGSEMKGFLEGNGIKQTLIPAYHPQSNGLAERAVRTIKTALDKNKRKIGDTPFKTPYQKFFWHIEAPRILASRVRDQQARQMKYDRRTHLEEFQIDDLVWCKNFRGGDKWIPGKIVGKKGTRVYTILIHGQVKAYHRDQIRKRWRNGEEDESGDGERQPEHSRGAGPSAIISEVVRDRGYMESLSPGLTSQRSDQDSEVQSDTDDGKSLEPLRSLDPEALKEEDRDPTTVADDAQGSWSPLQRGPAEDLHQKPDQSEMTLVSCPAEDLHQKAGDDTYAFKVLKGGGDTSPAQGSWSPLQRGPAEDLHQKAGDDTYAFKVQKGGDDTSPALDRRSTETARSLSLSPDGNSYPVQYYSRTLRKYERNYTTTELECLAIIETVDRFKVYLAGNCFTIFTDHCALQWLKNIKNPTGRLFRWSLRLSVYDYQVKYIKGTKQLEADLLSRNPFCGLLDATQLKMYQSELWDNSKYVHQTSGLTTITRRGVSKIVVPPSLRPTILREAHQKFNHQGISQLTRIISAQYFWSGMSIDIRALVKNCNICQMSKTPKGPNNHPQANGLSEGLNATLTRKLRLLHLQHPRVSWSMLQTKVVKAYNDTSHSVTGFPPSYLMNGSLPKELSQHLDPYPSVTESRRLALQRTKEGHKLDKIRFDKNHRFPDFEVGDLVLRKIYQHPNTGKLVPYFSGSYEIIEVISPYTVRINRPNQAQNLDTEIIHSLPLEQLLDYECLVHALTLRFGDDNLQPYHVVKLKNRLQKRDETLQELAADVRRLARLAFPDCPRHVQDLLAHQNFVDAIEDPECQQLFRMSDARTLKEALIHALKFEAARDATRSYQKVVRLMKADESQEDGDIKEAMSRLQKTVEEMKKVCLSQNQPQGPIASAPTDPMTKRSAGTVVNQGTSRLIAERRKLAGLTGPRLDKRCDDVSGKIIRDSSLQGRSNELTTEGLVNGVPCRMVIDSGANVTLLRVDLAQRMGSISKRIPVSSELIGNNLFSHLGYLADIKDDCLIGLDVLRKFGFSIDFQENATNKVLKVILKSDVKIPLRSECILEEHLINLERVLQKIRGARLKLNPRKCQLFKEKFRYLGHPIPSDVHQLRSFLGLCSYYRRFVPGFSNIARPLHRLTESGRPFSWTVDCERAMDKLKKALSSPSMLAYPDPGEQFILDTDASNIGIRAVLSQPQDGVERVIAYFSKTLSKPERNYCVTRKRLLAIVKSIEHFRHSALRWLFNFKSPEGQLKRTKDSRAKLKTYNVRAPFERIAIDIMGQLPRSDKGNRYILVKMDYFTKWPEAFPLADQEAETVAEALISQFFKRYRRHDGIPTWGTRTVLDRSAVTEVVASWLHEVGSGSVAVWTDREDGDEEDPSGGGQ